MPRLLFKSLRVPSDRPHVAVTRLKGECATTPHGHDFFETFLVLEGNGRHHWNGKVTEIGPGYLAMLGPEDGHWYSLRGGESLIFINVAISALWWKSFSFLFGSPLATSRERTLPSRDRLNLERSLLATQSGEPMSCAAAWNAVRHALQDEEAAATPPPAPLWLEDLRRELRDPAADLTQPIQVWQRRSGRSPEHFARSCRRHYGITPSELINQARIERAQYLLRATDDKVISIAFECGFGNLSNFHRAFNRLTGTTPGAWREASSEAVPIAS